MTGSRIIFLRVLAAFCILLLGCTPPPPPRPPDVFPLETEPVRTGLTVMGEAFYLAPGSVATFLLHVGDPYNGTSFANAPVEVRLIGVL